MKIVDSDFDRHKYERTKLVLLSIAFFFTIAGYTLIKELKDALFVGIVGENYLGLAKQLTLFIIIPLVMLYSKLVDDIRRYQLLYFYSLLYGLLGLVFAYFIGHSDIGIINTDTSPYRYFGWLLYFFFEGYSPFIVGVFWAFANSVSSPSDAKKNYALITASSKLGGVASAAGAWFLLSWQDGNGNHIYSDVGAHQILFVAASALLLCVPIAIYFLMKKVPGRYLHGYEAVYQIEKEKKKKGQEKTGVLAGACMLVRYPYVFGIFGMLFFYEIVNVTLNFQRIKIVRSVTKDLSGLSSHLFETIFYMHLLGVLIAFLGTRALVKKFGERRCLLFIPIVAGILLAFFMLNYSLDFLFVDVKTSLMIVYITIRSLNYGFSVPLREALYIPTVKEVKFKSKSWIDSTGSKLAKAAGASFYDCVKFIEPGSFAFLSVYSAFFAGIIGLWIAVAYLLGKRYDWAVANNEVIGAPVQPA